MPVATACAGALLATSYADADGIDLRTEDRRTGLADLTARSSDRVGVLTARAATLQREVDRLSAELADSDAEGSALGRTEEDLTALRDVVGLRPVAGPGLTVVLDDAPGRAIDAVSEEAAALEDGTAPEVSVSDLVVHQQDIQAVANALWEAGAEAMTIRGQRVIATTGIKCVGNAVILHGVPYSPPYDIRAVGDPTALRESLAASAYVSSYRDVAAAYGLGYEVLSERELRLPGYTGPTALRYASPLDG